MKKKLLFSITIALFTITSFAQRYEWVSHSTQSGMNTYVPVAVDPAGNIYTLIHANADVIIQGDTIHALTSSQGIVITKFDPSGNFLWGKMVNCDGGLLSAQNLAVDKAGAVYACYEFGNGGQVHMADTTFLPTIVGHYELIIKLDSSGHFVRARSFDHGSPMPISCLGTDLYIGLDESIEKLDSSLNTVWTVSTPPALVYFSGGNGTDIFVSPNGDIIASGYEFSNGGSTVPFGNDSIRFVLPGPYNEEIAVKLDTSGQVLWTKALNFQSAVKAVCLDSHGSAYLGITSINQQEIFGGDTLVNNVGAVAYSAILKWDSAGIPVRGLGLYPYLAGLDLKDLAVNARNELLVSGWGGPGNQSLNGDTVVYVDHTSFLFKFDSSGNFMWHKAGPPGMMCSGDGIAVRNGNEYIQGGSASGLGPFVFDCFQYTPTTETNFVTLISELPELNPVASFTYTVTSDTVYTFTDQSQNADSWHWDFGDGDASNLPSPTHGYNPNDTFTVCLTTYNQCRSNQHCDTVMVAASAGISEIALSNISIYPNPTANMLTIDMRNNNDEITRNYSAIEIYSSIGEKVRQLAGDNSRRDRIVNIAVSELAEGIYMAAIVDAKGTRRMLGAFAKQ